MLDQLKTFFGFEEETEIAQPVIKQTQIKQSPSTNTTDQITKTAEPKPIIKSFNGKVISGKNKGQSEIKIEEPKIYEDSLNIATYLRENKPVIVNLKHLDSQTGKRLIDFICGTAYAINGHMMKIGENIFLFTPAKVLIANSDDKSQLEEGIAEDEKEVF